MMYIVIFFFPVRLFLELVLVVFASTTNINMHTSNYSMHLCLGTNSVSKIPDMINIQLLFFSSYGVLVFSLSYSVSCPCTVFTATLIINIQHYMFIPIYTAGVPYAS